jgi:hypothetical protein
LLGKDPLLTSYNGNRRGGKQGPSSTGGPDWPDLRHEKSYPKAERIEDRGDSDALASQTLRTNEPRLSSELRLLSATC